MNLIFKALFLACLVSSARLSPLPPATTVDDPIYLLPGELEPDKYDLTLTVHLKEVEKDPATTYDGDIVISLTSKKADIESVKLHSTKDTVINTGSLIDENDPADPKVNLLKLDADNKPTVSFDEITGILTLILTDGTKLPNNGKYTLTLGFTGKHRTDMNGFYSSSYVDKTGKHWLLTTQFESSAARSAFPCFDEPDLKANYDIKIKVDKDYVDNKGYHALSNTKIKDITEEGDFRVFTFDTTPEVISTYLVAFIISDFKRSSVQTIFNDDLEYRTYGQPKYIDELQDGLSQKAGPAALDVLRRKLGGIKFKYPKMDAVGIPDFSAGAMENWGLVTFRERMLFFDDNSNSEAVKQSTVAVITHELAHQWFGDLVTLQNWDNIWLNEGFADFFEYHAANEIKVPELDTSDWGFLEQFVTAELQSSAFETDGLPNSRALQSETKGNPNIIENNFDNIAYAKGASVIRMWMHVLGEKFFYNGLVSYLNAQAGKNGNPDLLLNAFAKTVDDCKDTCVKPSLPDGKTLQDSFKLWVTQAGYPVIKVMNVDGAKYNVTQERFIWKEQASSKADPAWDLPISCSSPKNLDFSKTSAAAWLKSTDDKLEFTVPNEEGKPEWIIVNNREAGYYRVNYEEENWNALADVLANNHTIIDPINRAQILDDSLSIARSTALLEHNSLDYSIPLKITQYLENEEDYVPWSAALNAFSFLNTKLSSDSNYNFLKNHILKGVSARYNDLGLDINYHDDHITRLLRILIANWACTLGDQNCIKDAKAMLESEKISPDVKAIVYCTNIRQNEIVGLWDDVLTMYKNSDNNLDQTIYLSALGCTKKETNLDKYFAEIIKDKDPIIKKQDLGSAFASIYTGNPGNVNKALKFLNESLETLAELNQGVMNPAGKMLTGIASRVISAEDMELLNATLTRIDESTDALLQPLKESTKSAWEVLESTQHWLEAKQPDISQWLGDTYGGGSKGTTSTEKPDSAAGITVSIVTIVTCLSLIFSY